MLAQEIINSKKNIENNFDEEIKLQERKVEPVMKNDEESINLILNRISDLTTDYNLDKAVDKARREHDMNDGKYNLAIKLQHHQNEKKLKRLEELNVNDFSLDSKSLVDNAKFLGLERAGVETKKGLSDLVSDKTRLMKLSEKFFVNSK